MKLSKFAIISVPLVILLIASSAQDSVSMTLVSIESLKYRIDDLVFQVKLILADQESKNLVLSEWSDEVKQREMFWADVKLRAEKNFKNQSISEQRYSALIDKFVEEELRAAQVKAMIESELELNNMNASSEVSDENNQSNANSTSSANITSVVSSLININLTGLGSNNSSNGDESDNRSNQSNADNVNADANAEANLFDNASESSEEESKSEDLNLKITQEEAVHIAEQRTGMSVDSIDIISKSGNYYYQLKGRNEVKTGSSMEVKEFDLILDASSGKIISFAISSSSSKSSG